MVEPVTGPIAGLVLTVVIWTAAVVLVMSMAAAGRRDEWGAGVIIKTALRRPRAIAERLGVAA